MKDRHIKRKDMDGAEGWKGIIFIMKDTGRKIYLSDSGDFVKIMDQFMRVNSWMERQTVSGNSFLIIMFMKEIGLMIKDMEKELNHIKQRLFTKGNSETDKNKDWVFWKIWPITWFTQGNFQKDNLLDNALLNTETVINIGERL
jgi:hypothetical protein